MPYTFLNVPINLSGKMVGHEVQRHKILRRDIVERVNNNTITLVR